ncbi:hypothetical protein JHJ32_07815 [Parapedobacter sp. ISTM3]|uniref:hypothetical protein n=1 Tax=Parapedobacter sp. ISTM3 TaxID=2800130 RepID=UPI001902C42E|nr:hypothetical protein [Parapedobacter sp. ISTM3]MBK1439885.1 hypothetical protein [Parapedobacter sp. ISTM3]
MSIHRLYLIALCIGVASCTKDKTDYEAEISTEVPEHYAFEEAVSFGSEGYGISIEALNGTFYKGYNEIRLTVTDAQTGEPADVSTVTFLPVMSRTDGSSSSGPHRYELVYEPDDNRFSGYAVFTDESRPDGTWEFYIDFTVGDQTHAVKQSITVEQQANKNLNMTAFTGDDGEQYVIALVAPQRPKVAENELVAGIYRYNDPAGPAGTFPDPAQFSYTEANDYTLLLDPRMPEPSMGNHSSPNNKNLTQQSDGLYYGVVNYTMTGNWTLNFILVNPQGKILKGTEVPTDFTPGVEGVKSELYIDILF